MRLAILFAVVGASAAWGQAYRAEFGPANIDVTTVVTITCGNAPMSTTTNQVYTTYPYPPYVSYPEITGNTFFYQVNGSWIPSISPYSTNTTTPNENTLIQGIASVSDSGAVIISASSTSTFTYPTYSGTQTQSFNETLDLNSGAWNATITTHDNYLPPVQCEGRDETDTVTGTIPITLQPLAFLVLVTKGLGSASDVPGCACAGDPVSVGTGNLYEQVTDYRTPGSNVLSFSRTYNSLSGTNTLAASLGRNWRSNYDRYLAILSSSSVLIERADGQVLTFALKGNSWTTDSDVDLTLTKNGSTWMLTDSADTVETYSTINQSEALLMSVQLRNGYAQTLKYNAGNQLASVTDSYNRTLGFTYQNGLLQTVTTPDGLILTYAYASSGTTAGVLDRLASVSYSTTPTTSQSYLYENAGLPFALTGVTDEDGNRYASWTYDGYGRGLTSQHGGGADLTTFTYNDTDGSRTVTNALGEQEKYKFTTLQGVPKVTEIDRLAAAGLPAATRTFTYDSNGYTASQTDWNGNLTAYVNDVHGQGTSVTEASGTPQARTTTITYHPTFHLPASIVTPGLTTSFTYDASGNMLTKTDTDTTSATVPYSTNGVSRTWTSTWSNFLPASLKGPRTDVSQLTKFTYDNSGALTAVTNALNQATQITAHTPGGLPLTIVDPNGVTTKLTYDARQRLLTSTVTTAAGPLATKYTYDAAGNLLSVTQPDGSALTNTYDIAHRLVGVADLFNQKITYALDALGDRTQTKVLDAAGTTQRTHSDSFDVLGRLVQDIGGAGQTTAFARDANGSATALTDPLSRVTQQAFDALNRVIKVTDAASGIATTSYDAHDRPTSVTDPNGNTTTYLYDGFGDIIQQISPATGTTVYHYDPAGNLVQKVDGRNATATLTYDALDRQIKVSYPANASENVTYTYDEAGHGFGIGRLTSVSDAAGTLSRSYDERANVLTESRIHGAVALLTSYFYDAASRVTSVTFPSGWTVAYARDSMGRITAVTTKAKGASSATPVLSNIGYEPFGPVNAQIFGNGIAETQSFDLDYRLTKLADAGASPFQSLTYGYDAANNVSSIADGVNSGNSQALAYDALNRLTSAAGGYGSLAYTYDPNGNRLTANSPSAVALDGLGSVAALAYNQAGRLATVNSSSQQLTQYTYDAFGHRLVKSGSSTGVTLFQYDNSGHLLEESDGQGNAQADYIYLDGRPVAEIAPNAGGKLYFLHADRLGTPQLATDGTKTAVWVGNYEPFGALTASSQTALLAQDLRLPGQENDIETGLYQNGFRDYFPGHGRYVESDPLGYAGSLQLYGYANNNPLKFVDPHGTWLTPVVATVVTIAVAIYIFTPTVQQMQTNRIFIEAGDPQGTLGTNRSQTSLQGTALAGNLIPITDEGDLARTATWSAVENGPTIWQGTENFFLATGRGVDRVTDDLIFHLVGVTSDAYYQYSPQVVSCSSSLWTSWSNWVDLGFGQ